MRSNASLRPAEIRTTSRLKATQISQDFIGGSRGPAAELGEHLVQGGVPVARPNSVAVLELARVEARIERPLRRRRIGAGADRPDLAAAEAAARCSLCDDPGNPIPVGHTGCAIME